ncbi:MAG TPA: glycosyltransferase, partial [Thermoanaerobaculia bacterium]|nr:glycosyltransferase [Thermoanaerobaculia bacterium]
PERPALEAQARSLGGEVEVRFLGARHGDEIARLLNAHRILVVPSRYDEPFGIVALEGIACGCLVIGSRGGGLNEAIGRCGLTFRNGDSRELADLLAAALAGPSRFTPSPEEVAAHLARHRGGAMVNAYLQVFEDALGSRREVRPC